MRSTFQEFDEFSFINKLLTKWTAISLSEEREKEIKSVLRFAIFWNLLEADPWFNKYVSLWKLENSDLHTKILTNLDEEEKSSLNYCILFFSQRYWVWENYNLPCKDQKEWNKWNSYQKKMKKTWEEQDEIKKQQLIKPSLKEYLKICLFIVYRLRNNLFHGIKQLSDLTFQNDLFNVANRFLSVVIASLKKYHDPQSWLSS